ncbi:MAG TPA: penicillin acylase family protein [Thermoleophilaceae bacterium]
MTPKRASTLKRGPGGVVQIDATSETDLYRGLGYCHGHDRALQLLLMRVLLSGRACALLQDDDDMFELDRFIRRVELTRGAREEVAKLTPEDRALAEAYCAGVNEALAARVPWELRVLRYRPVAWTVADSIAISRAMGYVQTGQHQADMERLLVQMVQAGVSSERLDELFPGLLDGLDVELVRQVRLGEPLVPENVRWAVGLPRALASNNWAIAPARTRSGSAILSCDPHLEVNRLPAVWYESVLALDDRFAIVATIPGLPFAALGRTNELAWGPTYGCMDMVDSWVEDCRDGCYRRRVADEDHWEPFSVRTEVIARKRQPHVTLTFFENDHGVLDGDPHDAGLYLSSRWSGAGTGAGSLAAGFAMLHAADVGAGMDALGRVETAWNWVLADSAGNIAYQMSGRMPVRREGRSGLVPLPGWEPENDWAGIAPPRQLPRARNPDAGYLATANNDLNHLGERHPINLPMGDDRATRIGELLESRSDWTLEAVQEMHMDVYSKQAERFMAILRPLLPLGERADVLRDWDCRYNPASHGAELFERFYRELLLDVFGGACGAEVLRYLLEQTAIVAGFFGYFDLVLLDPESGWFAPGGRDAAFRRAAEHALAQPPRPWSQRQQFSFKHLMLGGRLPKWTGFDRGPYPLRGGRASIHQGQVFRQGGRETSWAPSYRFATDLAQPVAHTTLAGGPSDRRFCRWYANEIEDWLAGRFKRLTASPSENRTRWTSRSPVALIARQLADPSGATAGLVAAWFNTANTGINRRAIEALDLTANDRVLDVGFGGGTALAQLLRGSPSRTVAGVEPSVAMIERVAKRFHADMASGRLVLEHGSAERLPFSDESFDALLSVHTVYFFADRPAALSEMRRVLKPGGRIVIAIWTPERMRRLPTTRHGFDLISPEHLAALAADAGLHDVRDRVRGHEALIYGRV